MFTTRNLLPSPNSNVANPIHYDNLVGQPLSLPQDPKVAQAGAEVGATAQHCKRLPSSAPSKRSVHGAQWLQVQATAVLPSFGLLLLLGNLMLYYLHSDFRTKFTPVGSQ
ncbi:hypothetical protein ABW19_dt0205637 [Dactylella cylindrospora]|nr:hypothetical protein ABW19_dt0205637 [Dactylella cylindrospora]